MVQGKQEQGKQDVITFKVDADLADRLSRVPNRSEFIRQALLASLDSQCPLCRGTGKLTPLQKAHWDEFARNHGVQECEECHAPVLVCRLEEQGHGNG